MLPPTTLNWSHILNIIIQQYLSNTTICIFWNEQIDFDLPAVQPGDSFYNIVNIARNTLPEELAADVVNHTAKREQLTSNGLAKFDDFVIKLIASLEDSHCVADIPVFVEAFTLASMYSIWRSSHNKYVFLYAPALEIRWEQKYFRHRFFQDQPNVLLVEGHEGSQSARFDLKTNKYVGPMAELPNQLVLLDRFYASDGQFEKAANLFLDKTADLEGREVVLSTFDYKPDVVLTYNSDTPNSRDLAQKSAAGEAVGLHIDGTEIRIMLEFCRMYNCTLLVDSSEDDWGSIYGNATGDGAIGMLLEGRSDVSLGAMYMWHDAYIYLDLTMYVGRSGITCVVPAPKRLASWFLPLQPFQATLWAAVLACLLAETCSLFTARHYQQHVYAQNERHVPPTSWLSSFKYACSTTFMLFVSQSSGTQGSLSLPLRVLLFACFMNDLVITSIYGGGLASILTIPSFEEVVDSLEGLQRLGLKWAASSEAWVSAIRGTDDDLINSVLANFDIYNETELTVLAKTAYMGFSVERLPFGHYAIEEHLSRDVVRNFKIMTDDIYFQYTVSFVPRLWPLLERYDRLICAWHSSGFDKYWEWHTVADYLDSQVQKTVEASLYYTHQESSRGPVKLAMSNFAGILLVWVLGVILACLAFMGELLWWRWRGAAKVARDRWLAMQGLVAKRELATVY